MATPNVADLAASARGELLEDILPFWRRHAVDHERGGFIGEMTNDLVANPEAGKGLILNADPLDLLGGGPVHGRPRGPRPGRSGP